LLVSDLITLPAFSKTWIRIVNALLVQKKLYQAVDHTIAITKLGKSNDKKQKRRLI